jgi:hypothetical protein
MTQVFENILINETMSGQNIPIKPVKLALQDNILLDFLLPEYEIQDTKIQSNDRILLTGQNNEAENGIYIICNKLIKSNELDNVDYNYIFVYNGTEKGFWSVSKSENKLLFVKIKEQNGTTSLNITSLAATTSKKFVPIYRSSFSIAGKDKKYLMFFNVGVIGNLNDSCGEIQLLLNSKSVIVIPFMVSKHNMTCISFTYAGMVLDDVAQFDLYWRRTNNTSKIIQSNYRNIGCCLLS